MYLSLGIGFQGFQGQNVMLCKELILQQFWILNFYILLAIYLPKYMGVYIYIKT